MTFLRANDLSVQFPDHAGPVLQGINLDIHPDERILLLGPSGSGKSTLLLALAGLIPRSIEAVVQGEVLLNDRPVAELKPDEVCRQLGFLFQDPESQFCMLYPDDEIAFGLENLRIPRQDIPKQMDHALKQVGLGDQQRETRIDRLSGGQQQRLALGSIIAQASNFVLFDEPTANLDPQGRRSVVKAAEAIAQSGKGLLVVEHNLDPWFPLLERLLILGPDGKLLDDGPPSDLFARWGRYLDDIGVWKPRAIQLAEVLTSKGYTFNPLPLNIEALHSRFLPKDALEKAVVSLGMSAQSTQSAQTVQPDSPSGPPMVRLSHVNFSYSVGPQVLHDIDLTIQGGEFWALVGPNGSGKSTLARTLIGMVKATGTIELQGQPIAKMTSRELSRTVGYVFQNPEHQFITDSVWEELAYSVRQFDMDPLQRKDIIDASLTFFGLRDLSAANPFTLSGGQKRRLSVASMLVGGQRLLVLDEPTFGQDRRSAHQLMERIFELNRSGVSVLMITHDLDLAARYTSHTAVLDRGTSVFTGPTEDLWKRTDILSECRLEAPFAWQVLEQPIEGGAENVCHHQSYRQVSG